MRRHRNIPILAFAAAFGLSTIGLVGCGSESESFASGEQLVEAQKRRAESIKGEAGPSRASRENRPR